MVNSYVKLPEGNQTCWKTLNLFWRNPVRHWRISQCCWQICDVWSKNLYSSCMFLQMTPKKLCSTSKQTYILQRCVCVCLRLNISGYKRYAFRTFRFSRHGSKRFFFAEFIGSQGTQFGWISHTSKRPVASGNSYWKSHWNDYLYVWLSCE